MNRKFERTKVLVMVSHALVTSIIAAVLLYLDQDPNVENLLFSTFITLFGGSYSAYLLFEMWNVPAERFNWNTWGTLGFYLGLVMVTMNILFWGLLASAYLLLKFKISMEIAAIVFMVEYFVCAYFIWRFIEKYHARLRSMLTRYQTMER